MTWGVGWEGSLFDRVEWHERLVQAFMLRRGRGALQFLLRSVGRACVLLGFRAIATAPLRS